MRRLLLTTASIIALGLAVPAMAQTSPNSPSNSPSPGTVSQPSSGQLPNGAKMDKPATSTSSSKSMNSASSASSTTDAKSKTATSSDMTKATTHKHASAGSSQTRDAQTALKAQGLYTGHIDGKSGPLTKNAIAQFQHKQGLTESGQLDSQTRARLMASNSGTSSSSMKRDSTISSSAPVQSLPSSGQMPNGAKMPTDRASTATRGNGG